MRQFVANDEARFDIESHLVEIAAPVADHIHALSDTAHLREFDFLLVARREKEGRKREKREDIFFHTD